MCVSPDGKYVVFWPANRPATIYRLSDKRLLKVGLPEDFVVPPFYFWNPSGTRFAFQAVRSSLVAKHQSGPYIVVVKISGDRCETQLLPIRMFGYNSFGVGWIDDHTIVFRVMHRQDDLILDATADKKERFVMYQWDISDSHANPRILLVLSTEYPSGGSVDWLTDGGTAYPVDRMGKNYVIYWPLSRKLWRIRMPENTRGYSTDYHGKVLAAVNQDQTKIFVAFLQEDKAEIVVLTS